MRTAKISAQKPTKKNRITIDESTLPTFEKVRVLKAHLVFVLSDAREIKIPLEWTQHIKDLSPDLRRKAQIIGTGLHAYWEAADEYIGVKNVLFGQKLFI